MPSPNTTYGAFNQGVTPTIACFKKSETSMGVDLAKLVAAMQQYVSQDVAPVWGTPATLKVTDDFLNGAWAMVFLDDADQQDALAYHELTPDGLPLAKVFVRTTIQNGDAVSVSASHELVEMLVDPAINMMTTGPDPATMYAYESADPVEDLSYDVAGIPMSDFVYPSYFEMFRKPSSVRFDHMNRVTRPFELLAGGYQIIYTQGKWSQVFGSEQKAKLFAEEERRGRKGHREQDRRLLGRLDPSEARATAA